MEGLTHIRNRPLLATAILAMAIGFMVTFLYDGLIALLVNESSIRAQRSAQL